MTSREISQWVAYEQVAGPLGSRYSDDMLAAIHEQLQRLTQLTGALFVVWGGGDNPAADPEKVKRPHEVFVKPLPPEDDPEYLPLDALMSELRRK
jgi:hypothetical protein